MLKRPFSARDRSSGLSITAARGRGSTVLGSILTCDGVLEALVIHFASSTLGLDASGSSLSISESGIAFEREFFKRTAKLGKSFCKLPFLA